MAMKRKPARKPLSEMTPAEKVIEAYAAIRRIRDSMQDDNRYGSYGQSCRDSIKRWEQTIIENGGTVDPRQF